MNVPVIGSAERTQAAVFNLLGKETGARTEKTAGDDTFDSFFQAFIDMYKETDQNIQASQDMQVDLALGKTDDIVGLTLAMEKANASLNFTVQVTNRLLEAYKEIMRLQI